MTVGGVAGAAAAAQLAERAKRDATHSDFYRFQQREQRRNGARRPGAGGCAEGGWTHARAEPQAAAGLPRHPCHYLAPPTHPPSAELLDLREKFEADKRRIAELRASRKWKPY